MTRLIDTQTAICTRPAAPRPISLPSISSFGLIDESTISITRFSFSSAIPCSR